jgi:hypothetical protein
MVVALVVLAAAQFARCYTTLTIFYLDLSAYANGTGPMPYQGRLLMRYPLRWAQHSDFLARHTIGREGAFRSPDALLITFVAFACMCFTCWLVTVFYMAASQRQNFAWLPAWLLLAICAVQYILHSQNVMYPYDLPSMALFTLGLYLIYTERVWWLVLLFPVATLNREVTMFLIPVLMLDRYTAEGVRGLLRPRVVVQLLLLCAIWLGLHGWVGHMFAANPTEMGSRLVKNTHNIFKPQYWPQLAATGAFLLPLLYVYRKCIVDARLRSYLWVILPWTAMMFFYGEIIETRLFGELGGLLAVTATLAFEEHRTREEQVAATTQHKAHAA